MMQDFVDENSSVFIATFSRYEKGKRLPTNGFVEQLLSFFLPRVSSVTLLDNPHPVSDSIDPIVEEYHKQKFIKRYKIRPVYYLPIYLFCKIVSKDTTRISFKLRDFFSTLFVIFISQRKYDLFIGLEGVYALVGIILKRMGKVKTVVYYVSDYSPNRFKMLILNTLYLWLDKFCVTHADFTWDVSPAMREARLKAGLCPKQLEKIIHVPNGLFPEQIKALPISKRVPNTLVYMGILDSDMGPDFAIRAMQEVVKKIPDATLHVVGGVKKDVIRLSKLSRRLKLEKNVVFYGFVKDNLKMAKIVRKCMVGIAPYRSFPDSIRYWGDAGKIRQYLASGLPVVTTPVPPLGRYVVKKGAALMREDTLKDFSGGITSLLLDSKLYRKLSKKAQEFSRENTWENSYLHALSEMKKRQY